MRRSLFVVPILALITLSALAQEEEGATDVQGPPQVIDLGGGEDRVCPQLTVTPQEFYNEMTLAAQKVGAERIPYRSCGEACRKGTQYQERLDKLNSLVPANAYAIAIGKPSSKDLHLLANALLANGREGEWAETAGIDCNGFTGRFIEANGWTGWGKDPKNNYPPFMSGLGVAPLTSTDQICPGDLVVYTGASHIELVGDRAGNTTLGGRTLALFQMYESAAAGILDGTYTSVQGIDISGGKDGKFRLDHINQLGKRASDWNDVMIYPGPGKP